MIRMYARRYTSVSSGTNKDTVIFGMSLPSGSRINGINLEVALWATTFHAQNNSGMYAVEGWILPVLDPDAAVEYNVLWDTLVPKDTDAETMDLDVGTADTTPFFEPGEPDFTGLFNVGLTPERIYHREKLLTMSTGALSIFRDPETPFAIEWCPGDYFRIRIRKNYAISQPSVLLFAIANPGLDDTTSTLSAAAAEAEWGQTKFIGHVLERALLHLLGLTEAGAESPWEEATALLKKHLEPDVFEETGGNLVQIDLNVICKGIVDHSVEGRLQQIQVSTG